MSQREETRKLNNNALDYQPEATNAIYDLRCGKNGLPQDFESHELREISILHDYWDKVHLKCPVRYFNTPIRGINVNIDLCLTVAYFSAQKWNG